MNNNMDAEKFVIIIGVCGSVAAVEDVKLIRKLKRHNFDVYVVMSENAKKIIGKDTLEWASEHNVTDKISGSVEHVYFCGVQGIANLLLICPCTANTISKIACGIDDTSVTTFATTALGSKKKIIIVPAMHISMYQNPFVAENVEKLKRNGIRFIENVKFKENKIKFPDIDEIVRVVKEEISKFKD
ncbi:MAG: flavoprotein [Candidatus Altarchaeum sp.]|nr:flavoprotein [Candidatus Altarchaeum sp.]